MTSSEAEEQRDWTYGAIYDVVCQVPPGKVVTYGQVAALANRPGQARLVGYALYRVDLTNTNIPWHRVINARGGISHSLRRHGTDHWQRSLLEAEGIEFSTSGRINLKIYRWQPLALKPDPNHVLGSKHSTLDLGSKPKSGGQNSHGSATLEE